MYYASIMYGTLCVLGMALGACSSMPTKAPEADVPVLRLEGEINEAMLQKLRNHLEKTRGRTSLEITSAGGDMRPGIKMGELIVRYKVDVVVNRYCMSGCAQYVFLTSPRPQLGPDGIVAFHNSADSNVFAISKVFDLGADHLLSRLRDEEAKLYEKADLPSDLPKLATIGLGILCVPRQPFDKPDRIFIVSKYPSYILSIDVLRELGVSKITGSWPTDPYDITRRLKLNGFKDTFGLFLINRADRAKLRQFIERKKITYCTP